MPGNDAVLMIGWEYPPHNSGGLGVACEGLTQALAGQNTQVYFTLPYNHSSQVDHMQMVGCYDPAWMENSDRPPFSAYGSTSLNNATKRVDAEALHALPQSEMEQRVAEYAHLVRQQARQLKDQFQVIHAHDWMSLPAAAQVKKLTGAPLIAHVHSTEHDRIPNGLGSPYIMQTEAEGLRMADRIIAVSAYTKKLLIEKYNLDGDRIEVVHNGVLPLLTPSNPGRHHFAAKRPVVVFMGRLTAQKGAEYFLQLAQSLLKKDPEILFVVAGHGDLYHELLFKTAYDRLSASVLFSGFVRDTQREKLLDRADVFIMPSLSEPFGLVALEAAQRHTPVIISKQSGVSEVLTSALAIDFWDIDKMTQSVLELLANKQYSQTTVKGQLQDLKSVTWDTAAQRVKDVYRTAFLGA